MSRDIPTAQWRVKRAPTRYKWFKEQWRTNDYPFGDAYQDEKQELARREWEITGPEQENYPYLTYLKNVASPEWPHIRLLADFMEVGTVPKRWGKYRQTDKPDRVAYPGRTEDSPPQATDDSDKPTPGWYGSVSVWDFEFRKDGAVEPLSCSRSQAPPPGNGSNPSHPNGSGAESGPAIAAYRDAGWLRRELRELPSRDNQDVELRLFIVEDLSRDVVEALGYELGIDPGFFRSHIGDYAWNNIRDPERDPPILNIDGRGANVDKERWYQMRFVRAFYFDTPESLHEGQKEVDRWNCERKLYDDENSSFWDSGSKTKKRQAWSWPWPWKREDDADRPEEVAVDAKVGLIRSKATFWFRPETTERVVENGKEVEKTLPPVGVVLVDPTPRKGFPIWRGYRNWDPIPSPRNTQARPDLGLLSLTLRDAHKQAGTFAKDFCYWILRSNRMQKPALDKVEEILLRLVCVEWLTIVDYTRTRLTQIDWEIAHPQEFLFNSHRIDIAMEKLHIWRRWLQVFREMVSQTLMRAFNSVDHIPGARPSRPDDRKGKMSLLEEFLIISRHMEENQERVDRLTNVVTAAISLDHSNRLAGLTWLATLLLPPSVVGTLFSMTDDLAATKYTFGWWALTSVVLLILVGFVIYWVDDRERKWKAVKARFKKKKSPQDPQPSQRARTHVATLRRPPAT